MSDNIAKNTKTAAVTGASRGIGRAVALKFAKKGYRVAICCQKSKTALEETLAQMNKFGNGHISYVGDMGNIEDAAGFFTHIQKKWGRLDILVNNAGRSQFGLLQDMSIEEWNSLINSNLTSVFCCSKFAIPMMLVPKHGKIINISSVWGDAGASAETAYSASKGGVNSLTKALAKELAPSGIQVNAVSCGMIDTEMNSIFSQEEINAICNDIPAGRMGTADEAADFICQLADSADYLTGQVIRFDGGWI